MEFLLGWSIMVQLQRDPQCNRHARHSESAACYVDPQRTGVTSRPSGLILLWPLSHLLISASDVSVSLIGDRMFRNLVERVRNQA
jgi:hypothetical protein